MLDRSLALGTHFLLANQKPAGNFQYELDWKTLRYSAGDSAVRQAGATWGLALIHQQLHRTGQPTKAVKVGLLRALRFFETHSKRVKDRRFVVYPGSERGSLGTVALVALALIDLLRVWPSKKWRAHLDAYLAFLIAARRGAGRFRGAYLHDSGKSLGPPSAYFDGEALLALVKAARYLGRSDLLELVLREADAGHTANVVDALDANPDSKVTKGYYQWACMAYFELATWPKVRSATHARRLLELTDWMIDVHQTLKRTRNTGYAYEGIIPAYAIAKRDDDEVRMAKLRCTVERGLSRLCSWQVANPLANRYIRARAEHDRRAVGGVQNHRKESRLRIDVTQHQMHAIILARRYVWPGPGSQMTGNGVGD